MGPIGLVWQRTAARIAIRRSEEYGDPAPRNVALLSATTALIVTALYTWYPVLPVLLQRRGADRLEVSVAYTLFGVAASVLQLYGGQLADRFGRRRTVALPTFAAGALYVVAFLSGTWQLLALALIAINVASAIQGPSFVALTAESVRPQHRAQAFSTFQFASGAATLIGPALGAALLLGVAPRWLMGLTAVASLIAASVRLQGLRDVRQAAPAARHLRLGDALRGNLLNLTLASTAFMLVAALTVNGPFIALYAHNEAGLPAAQVNLIFSIGWLPAVLLSFWLGRRIAAIGSARSLAVGVAGHLGLLGLWLVVRGFWPLVLVLMASFLFYQLAVIAYGTLRMELVDPDSAGSALGAVGTVSGVAAAFGPVLGGTIAGVLGPFAAFGLAGVAGIWTLLALRRLGTA